MSLSGLKDVDREVIKYIDDKELLKICSLDRKTWNEVCDDNFLMRRLLNKYPGIEKYKKENETWKSFFLRFVYYSSKMKEKYKFEYSEGDFKKQYDLLSLYINNTLLVEAVKEGELPIIKYAVKNGANIHISKEIALRYASSKGHLEIVKYLVEQGADIHADDDHSLTWASEEGHFDVVKYLVSRGASIHAANDLAVRAASQNGHEEIVKYLVKHAANIHAGKW